MRSADPDIRTCCRCLEPKPADAFGWGKGARVKRRQRVCLDCRAREVAEREQRAAARCCTFTAPDGRMTRRCRVCGKVKDLETGFHRMYRRSAGHPPSRRYQYDCRECQHERQTQPEYRDHARAAFRAYWECDPERARANVRRYRERVAADPARYRERLEKDRIDRKLRIERTQGVPITQRRHARPRARPVHDERRFPALPAAPLYAAVRPRLERATVTEEAFCEWLGISPRTLERWGDGEIEYVQFDTADRVVTRLGLLWFEVWDDEPIAVQAFEGAETRSAA